VGSINRKIKVQVNLGKRQDSYLKTKTKTAKWLEVWLMWFSTSGKHKALSSIPSLSYTHTPKQNKTQTKKTGKVYSRNF
jgi:hypothetical protein